MFTQRIFLVIVFAALGSVTTAQTLRQPTPFDKEPPISLPESTTSTTPLLTTWGTEVTPDNVHAEYPRPTLVRSEWLNLNGYWDWKDSGEKQEGFTRQILVPFPVESSLSRVTQRTERCLYRRTFTVPQDWAGDCHILLHFGAVDWEAIVFINEQNVGTHRGGYDSFSFDITPFIHRNEPNELIVHVFDPTQNGEQPRGKQSTAPSGNCYTASTGIWQTVWLEPVPTYFIKTFQVTRTDEKAGAVTILPVVNALHKDLTIHAEVLDGEEIVAEAFGGCDGPLLLQFNKTDIEMWSPDSPYLYQIRIQLLYKETPIDKVNSYFAFRKIEIVQEGGFPAIYLNGKRLFQMGIIDQGYWPDGLYTAPSDLAYRTDIFTAKSLGFNVIRKYQKIEPERWYYWCDRQGMLVWQDMPSGDNKSSAAQTQFRSELQRMIQMRSHHPSIVAWTIFNEGAGQHNEPGYVDEVRRLDRTRLVNVASGWTDSKLGDVNVSHKFPGPEMPDPDPNRAAVIGAFGGLTLMPPSEHLGTHPEKVWGYRHVPNSDGLKERYKEMHDELRRLIQTEGLAGAFFHQLSDIESECNGLTPYNRRILKAHRETLEQINRETIKIGSN